VHRYVHWSRLHCSSTNLLRSRWYTHGVYLRGRTHRAKAHSQARWTSTRGSIRITSDNLYDTRIDNKLKCIFPRGDGVCTKLGKCSKHPIKDMQTADIKEMRNAFKQMFGKVHCDSSVNAPCSMQEMIDKIGDITAKDYKPCAFGSKCTGVARQLDDEISEDESMDIFAEDIKIKTTDGCIYMKYVRGASKYCPDHSSSARRSSAALSILQTYCNTGEGRCSDTSAPNSLL